MDERRHPAPASGVPRPPAARRAPVEDPARRSPPRGEDGRPSIVPGPPRPLIPDALRADRGGGAPVELPDDLVARLDAARTRLRAAAEVERGVPPVEVAPLPDADELRARLDAARHRLRRPGGRRGGLSG
ncbi:hypothetical protein SK069_06130 [Patulibacter brassicae]|uniref:DUF1992 domain-containing protein n=1 Tax=Patulibacter brassicae TaxID=1705717 RepID=A0ABU4VH67_9ACTN|nr:hypothetical protein [Patulibacter brassicae]MDX8151162.1 hypothetical protein [Patulibacter brassicae]